MNEFLEVNDSADKRPQRALRQPLLDKQRFPMIEASFQAAGYAFLSEDDAIEKVRQHAKYML